MKSEEIRIDDLWRILVGEVPASFFIEVIVRTAFIFFLLVICMRLLGKRMAGQLNKIEMISLTTLAAAAGVPLQAPDRGLLPTVIIALIVILGGRLISILSLKNKNFERLSQDTLSILVENSVLQLDQMKKTKITRERLFAYLRSISYTHLGQVKRVYLEAGGFFTLVEDDQHNPGLIILPEWDKELIGALQRDNLYVCSTCGKIKGSKAAKKCDHCGGDQWVLAAKDDD